MDPNGNVYPNCPNAGNPYHECGTHCLEKIAQGKGTKGRNKLEPQHSCACIRFWPLKLTSGASILVEHSLKEKGGKTSKLEVGRAANSSCPRASNPYHECDENCLKRNTNANSRGFRREPGTKLSDVSKSFGKKNKGSDSQPISPRTVENTVRASYPTGSLQSHFAKTLEENSGSFISHRRQSEEIDSQDRAVNNRLVQSTDLMPGKLRAKDNLKTVATSHNKRMGQNEIVEEKVGALPKKIVSDPSVGDEKVAVSSPMFRFSAVGNETRDSDDEEVESVISDSCVFVGKYRVKARVSAVLQSIFENYGDIAANCHLESTSMLAYYLECLCAVVQELEATPFKQLTRTKMKEMFSVLKDVESAGIDVNWLRGILNEISEAVELVGDNQSMTGARASCHRALESTRKALESQMEDLSRKEKEAADSRERVAEIKTRLSQLELECSRLDKMISSVKSVVKKYGDKPVGNE